MSPKHPSGYRIGLVNPLTLAGNEISTILRERAFPLHKLVLLDSTGNDAGALTDVGNEPAVVTAISDDELEDCDLVFFTGPAAANREWIDKRDEDNFIAVDLSQATADEGRLTVADLNLDEAGDGRLLVSPHPVAIPIALLLHQLQELAPIDLCIVSVIQPASEFEQKGVEELAQQTVAVLNIQSVPKEVFERQLAFNLYPAAARGEETILAQVRALTGARTELALFITQGTIFHSHTLSLFFKTRDDLDAAAVAAKLRENPAIDVAEGDQEIGTSDAAGKDQVLVADVRPAPGVRGGFWVWAVCDNLRRGSALNAVLVAEKALSGGGMTN
jgi:aspartate-semialdehyde dehydrogenase